MRLPILAPLYYAALEGALPNSWGSYNEQHTLETTPPMGVNKPMKNIVVFGDSYSDVDYVWDGGIPWPVYVERYSGARLYPYATSGGTCSNKIVEKPYPSVFEYQIPKYLGDQKSGKTAPSLDDTLFTIWIGTNDVGIGGLLNTPGNLPGGTTLVDTSRCVSNWVSTMYEAGARNFLVQNMVPLEANVLYSADTYPNFFWTGEHNATHWNLEMKQMTRAGNTLVSLMLKELAPSLPEAHIGVFDSNALFGDILQNPTTYLNGTGPVELRQPVKSCVYEANADITTAKPTCSLASSSHADNHVWYDELHPSEQVNRIIAKEVVKVVKGEKSRWTQWVS
jgi:phospholipase/lecithinase/hemolysin